MRPSLTWLARSVLHRTATDGEWENGIQHDCAVGRRTGRINSHTSAGTASSAESRGTGGAVAVTCPGGTVENARRTLRRAHAGERDDLTVHGASRRRWPCSPQSYASSEHTGGRGASVPPRAIVIMTETMDPSGCSGETSSKHIPAEHDQEQEPERKTEPAPRTGGYGRSRGNMLGSGN